MSAVEAAVHAPKGAPPPVREFHGVAEAPRYSCALGGAYGCTLATFGAVPILHSGPGCALAQNFGQNFAGALNGAGSHGNTSTPCSCLVEEHVVFGGEGKLRALIKSSQEVVRAKLFPVISGCVPALIGDDVASVVREFKDAKVPVVHVSTAGFLGNTYRGYEAYLEAMIDQLTVERPKIAGSVNLLGVVPFQHIFWKGNLQVIKSLLERIGLKVNMIFTEDDGAEALRSLASAEFNLLFSPWNGLPTAKKLSEKYGTPYLTFAGVPIGPKDTTAFLRRVAERVAVDPRKVEALIEAETRRAYRFTEFAADIVSNAIPHAYTGIVADTPTAISLTRFASNEQSWLPEVVIVTDDPPEELRGEIRRHLTEGLDSVVKPEVIFEYDSHKIRLLLREHTLQLLLASSLEKYIATEELDALQISVAFPTYDRLIVDRSYAGYRGGLNILEDFAAKYGGPL